ncbi:MAG: hypothetical protein HQM10_06085 [Candidatus Riflebacteria bacterium]|nr:hypothetical protein [Candidatus Riflebacteria bacterium]
MKKLMRFFVVVVLTSTLALNLTGCAQLMLLAPLIQAIGTTVAGIGCIMAATGDSRGAKLQQAGAGMSLTAGGAMAVNNAYTNLTTTSAKPVGAAVVVPTVTGDPDSNNVTYGGTATVVSSSNPTTSNANSANSFTGQGLRAPANAFGTSYGNTTPNSTFVSGENNLTPVVTPSNTPSSLPTSSFTGQGLNPSNSGIGLNPSNSGQGLRAPANAFGSSLGNTTPNSTFVSGENNLTPEVTPSNTPSPLPTPSNSGQGLNPSNNGLGLNPSYNGLGLNLPANALGTLRSEPIAQLSAIVTPSINQTVQQGDLFGNGAARIAESFTRAANAGNITAQDFVRTATSLNQVRTILSGKYKPNSSGNGL